jgi:hypothetical protein
MTLDRKVCVRCGRVVAWRVVRGARASRIQTAIPPLRQPVAHNNQQGQPCQPTKRPP